MAITSIQPITNFSTILPATFVSPAEMLSVATEKVTTASASAIVTLGAAQPISLSLFNAAGVIEGTNGGGLAGFPTTGISLGAPGSVAQTPQSQALADELTAALTDTSSMSFGTALSNALNAVGTLNGTAQGSATTAASSAATIDSLANANLDLAALTLNLPAGTTSSELNGALAASVGVAIAGIGSAANATAAVGTPGSPAPAVIGIPSTTAALGTTATAAGTAPVTAATAATPATTATPTAVPVTPATPTTAVPTAIAVTTTPTVTTPAAVATLLPAATPATGTATAVAPPLATGLNAATALQNLVANATASAIANLTDPGFAATAAGLFVNAAIFRAANDNGTLLGVISTADVAGSPAAAVTAVQPPRAV